MKLVDTASAARTDHRELAELAAQLVAIDSINPDLIPGAAGESAIAEFVAGWLRAAGLEVELYEAAPGRSNAVGVARGSGGGRSLLLNAHMGTVGVGGGGGPVCPPPEGRGADGGGGRGIEGK